MIINILDFEDGLQEFLSSVMPDSLTINTINLDERGRLLSNDDLFLSGKNILILSKPYDCLERGVRIGKYPEDNENLMWDWARRNYIYNTADTYDKLNNLFESITDKLVLHPDELFLNTESAVNKLRNYLGINDLEIDTSNFGKLYKEMVNIR